MQESERRPHPTGEAPPDAVSAGHSPKELQDGRAEQFWPTPHIWVGSWLDYNHGILHGDWISAAQTDEQITEAIAAMLARSPTSTRDGDVAEDWGIFDHDNFGPLRIGEQEDVGWVGAVGRGIAKHGPAFAAYADVVEDRAALAGFEDDYLGNWESLGAYAESFTDDAGYNQLLDEALPDSIRPYVRLDTAAIARDMQAEGSVHVVALPDGAVALFAANG